MTDRNKLLSWVYGVVTVLFLLALLLYNEDERDWKWFAFLGAFILIFLYPEKQR